MPARQTINKFWSVRAETTVTGTIIGNLYLYGVIASRTWRGDEVTPKVFREDIEALGDIAELNVHIFSDGGDYFAGNAIYSIIKQHPAITNAYYEGIGASMATIVGSACDNVYVSRNAHLLIHLPMLALRGHFNRLHMETMQNELLKYEETMAATYAAKTGRNRDEALSIMYGENMDGTWHTAQEAIDIGLADGYIPEENDSNLNAVACIAQDKYSWNGLTFDLSTYNNPPKITNRRLAKMPRAKRPAAKKPPARDVRAEIVSMTCPECGHVFDVEVNSAKSDGTDAQAGVSGELISATCPECGHVFDFEHTIEDNASIEGAAQGKQDTAGTVVVAVQKKVVAELLTVYCPECWNSFAVDTGSDSDGASEDSASANAQHSGSVTGQIYTVTCPECGHEFNVDSTPTISATPIETVEPSGQSFNDGVLAERERLVALDGIVQADPNSGKIVAIAKAQGWSYERTCKAVFDNMGKREKLSLATAHLQTRKAEIAASGTGRVGAVPNSGANTASNTAQAKAVSMIAAGMKKKTGGKHNG